jgi:sugar O-acyltransferase (sialic acid O-acetyltransferase NeuD family)
MICPKERPLSLSFIAASGAKSNFGLLPSFTHLPMLAFRVTQTSCGSHSLMMEKITIIGAGGLGREVLAALSDSDVSVSGFLVDPGYPVGTIAGLRVRDDTEAWSGVGPFVVAIGDVRARSRIVDRLAERSVGVLFGTVQHPAAVIGPRVTLGSGSLLIGALSITADVAIGDHVLVNPGCAVAHDCRIDRFVNLGPRVALAGGVVIEEGADLGIGAVVAPRCRIGAWAVVGAGAVVVDDVAPGFTVAGVPARPIEGHGSRRPKTDRHVE